MIAAEFMGGPYIADVCESVRNEWKFWAPLCVCTRLKMQRSFTPKPPPVGSLTSQIGGTTLVAMMQTAHLREGDNSRTQENGVRCRPARMEVSMSAGLRIIVALLLAQAPAVAGENQPLEFPDQQTQEQWKRAERLAHKGVEELLRSFELFKDALPEYGVPYINRDGDIVIPRRWRPTPHLGTPVPSPRPERT
jgi:hypothetical protein